MAFLAATLPAAPLEGVGVVGGILIIAHRVSVVIRDLYPELKEWIIAKKDLELARAESVDQERLHRTQEQMFHVQTTAALTEILNRTQTYCAACSGPPQSSLPPTSSSS